jgi:predicted lipoprotein with Yx(FWY)xxD motif
MPGLLKSKSILAPSRVLLLTSAALSGFGVAALASLAIAKPAHHTLGIGKNVLVDGSTRETIVVNGHGVAVYDLIPETTKNLLCTKANGCLAVWLPVTVPSKNSKLTKATGIKGKLGLFHRNGVFQVTLGGHPLYRFKLDHNQKGVANGDKVMSFGGTWHVFRVSGPQSGTGGSNTGSTGSTGMTSTMTTTCTGLYCYPY